MEPIPRRAHAKINVFLRVLGRRDEGFHDLETLVLPVSLHDDVVVRSGVGGEVVCHVTGEGSLATAVADLPGENLVVRAAGELARTAFGTREPDLGALIDLHKRIPVAAGLGGGSADAAATLLALRELWGCTLSDPELSRVGATIGSDVPAMLACEPVLAYGRGERLTSVHALTTWWVVKPSGFPVSAADAYAWWDERPATGPDAGALIAALETGRLELLGSALFNDLQGPVTSRHPEITDTIAAFLDAGALGAVMSGSGPTVAALARDVGHADRLASAVPGSLVVSAPPTATGAPR